MTLTVGNRSSVYRNRGGEVAIRNWCRRRLDRWTAPHERLEIDTDLGRTHLVVAGTGDEGTVLYLPGTNFNAATSLLLAGELAARARVVIADLPGQPGLSSGARPTGPRIAAYGSWAGEVVDEVRRSFGAGPLLLVGHSLGAAVALAAPTAGVAALVLIDPAGLVRVRVSPAVLLSTLGLAAATLGQDLRRAARAHVGGPPPAPPRPGGVDDPGRSIHQAGGRSRAARPRRFRSLAGDRPVGAVRRRRLLPAHSRARTCGRGTPRHRHRCVARTRAPVGGRRSCRRRRPRSRGVEGKSAGGRRAHARQPPMRTGHRSVLPLPRWNVLISGAGIAGATLAGLLSRRGHRVTVVEYDQGVRSSGNPVDVRGHAYDLVERIGLLPRLEAAATHVTEIVLVDSDGRPIARTPSQRSGGRGLEIPRADLSAILLDACPPEVETVFGDEISRLEPDGDGVDVTFGRTRSRRFDLVVGADGLHSRVRRLLWGPEEHFSRPLHLYVASTNAAGAHDRDDAVLVYNEPGLATALHPAAGAAIAAFIFRSDVLIDPRNPADARSLLTATYGSAGWRSRELLGRYLSAEDVYFDVVSRVRVPTWTKGRVTLLGDAASCVSLFGEGSSSAISGAAALADALDRHPSDLPSALRSYEHAHRKLLQSRSRGAILGSHLVVPGARLELVVRDAVLKLAQHQLGPRRGGGSRTEVGLGR